jgi:hypothetical protein
LNKSLCPIKCEINQIAGNEKVIDKMFEDAFWILEEQSDMGIVRREFENSYGEIESSINRINNKICGGSERDFRVLIIQTLGELYKIRLRRLINKLILES